MSVVRTLRKPRRCGSLICVSFHYLITGRVGSPPYPTRSRSSRTFVSSLPMRAEACQWCSVYAPIRSQGHCRKGTQRNRVRTEASLLRRRWAYPPAIAALTSLVPTMQILFGSDNPFIPLSPYEREPARSSWYKIKNRSYSQMVGRHELFERERHLEPVPGWHSCTLVCSESAYQL